VQYFRETTELWEEFCHILIKKILEGFENNKNVIKLYYGVHDKLQAIFNFYTFSWINRNTVVLLRLTLVLVNKSEGK